MGKERIEKNLLDSSLEMERKRKKLRELQRDEDTLQYKINEMQYQEELSLLHTQLEGLKHELKENLKKWTKYKIAAYLLKKAKEKYEKEKQPNVIREASQYFKIFTKGKYRNIKAPIGENKIYVTDSMKNRKTPEKLSRGTAEQLYLAIRFGYVNEKNKNSEPVPVIMDDILVNFDHIRVKNAIKSIIRLSENNQILFFSCHPEIIGIFNTMDKNIQTFDLQNIKNRRYPAENHTQKDQQMSII